VAGLEVSGNAAHVARWRARKVTGLLSTTPLAFELACNDGVVATLGDAVGVFAELTPEQRDTHWWTTAIHMINTAIKEPRYLTAATITMLAQPPEDH
jgi:hypothetical protein